jgi:two-component system KDP operon response regulator KdpE
LGANDYVTKPFGTAELMARMRAALRSRRSDSSARQTFTLDDLTIDFDKRQVTLSGEIIPLTQTEYNILAFLSDHAGKVLTYSAIIQAVWGYADTGSTKRLQVNMANIRKKLQIAPGKDGYILNELGVGYRMREPGEL